jgi:hypothetical protein
MHRAQRVGTHGRRYDHGRLFYGPRQAARMPGLYTAYLVKSGDSYAPAARGQSFIASPQGAEAPKTAAPC